MAKKIKLNKFEEKSFKVPVTLARTSLNEHQITHNVVEVSRHERARLYLDKERSSLDELMEAKYG